MRTARVTADGRGTACGDGELGDAADMRAGVRVVCAEVWLWWGEGRGESGEVWCSA